MEASESAQPTDKDEDVNANFAGETETKTETKTVNGTDTKIVNGTETKPETGTETKPETDTEIPASSEATATTASTEAELAEEPAEEPVCWICYGPCEPDNTLLSPCKCKGTMQYAHQSCLLEWLDQSDTKECPHCQYAYQVDTSYTTVLHEWLDRPQVPYILSAVVLALCFYAFHKACASVLSAFRKRKHHPPTGHQRVSAMDTLWNRPETMGLLRTALPSFHPAFSLLMNGFQSPAPLSSWSITLLFAEFELFAFLIAVVFSLSHYAYKWYKNQFTPTVEGTATDTTQRAETESDVHEGFAEVSLLHEDHPTGDGEEDDIDRDSVVGATENTVWDVANEFWQETNIGGRHNLTEEAVYVFPFDVAQTAFYTLHYYIKQQQKILINKNIVIQSPTSPLPSDHHYSSQSI